MAAVVQIQWYGNNAAEPVGVNAESGLKFTRDQTVNGGSPATPIPIPTAGSPGATDFSYLKQLALAVTSGGGTTSLLNRKVNIAASPGLPTGVNLWFAGSATYVNDTAGAAPADSTTANSVTPAGYSAVTTSAQVYDATLVACGTGYPARNGNFCDLVLGVSFNYAGGAGSLALPNIVMTYDEQ